jgi:hypothetical protein
MNFNKLTSGIFATCVGKHERIVSSYRGEIVEENLKTPKDYNYPKVGDCVKVFRWQKPCVWVEITNNNLLDRFKVKTKS